MLENIEVSKETVTNILTFATILYVACLVGFLGQLRDIIKSADQNFIAALKRLHQLLSCQEISREATKAYSELVEAYESYRRIQRFTNIWLIIASILGVIILLLASLLLISYSELLALILAMLLIAYVVAMVRIWLVSFVKIIRFGP